VRGRRLRRGDRRNRGRGPERDRGGGHDRHVRAAAAAQRRRRPAGHQEGRDGAGRPGGHQQGRHRRRRRHAGAGADHVQPAAARPARQPGSRPPQRHRLAPAGDPDQRLAGAGRRHLLARRQRFRRLQTANGQLAARRQHQALAWMWERIDAGLKQAFRQNPQVRDRLPQLEQQVGAGTACGLHGSAATARGARGHTLTPLHSTLIPTKPYQRGTTMHDILEQLEKKRAAARLGGGQKRIDAQHAKGKLTARERIEVLLDEGTFEEWDMFVEHRCADFGMAGHQDPRRRRGHRLRHDQRPPGVRVQPGLHRVRRRPERGPCRKDLQDHGPGHEGRRAGDRPERFGRRPHPGRRGLAGRLCRRVPAQRDGQRRDSADQHDHGPCAGGAVYSPGHDRLHLHGQGQLLHVRDRPRSGEDRDARGSDGRGTGRRRHPHHQERRGRLAFENDVEALLMLRRLYNYLPLNNREKPPVRPSGDPMDPHGPQPGHPGAGQPQQALRHEGADRQNGGRRRLLRAAARYAKNILIGFARMDGQTVGIVANQPLVLAGCLDIKSSIKAARFVRFCDAFNIPVITFVDVPGFMPGTSQEYGGIIKHGAKLLYAYAECTVPKITVITRKAYGGAYDVMASKHLRGDVNLAWPNAEIAVMGAKGAVEIIFREDKGDPAKLAAKEAEYKARFANPFVAGARGFIDDVILPHETRKRICRSLVMLKDKKLENPWRKHGNIPL
jgi:propionyl-CoA carboxylase beta chain